MIDHTAAIAKSGLGGSCRMLLAGELQAAAGGATMPALDPTTGVELATVPVARREDVDRAVRAAREAFDSGPWCREWGPGKRARALVKLAGLVRAHSRDLARIEALDVGMPIGFAKRFSVAALARNLEYYASWADKIYGDQIPQSSPTMLDYTRREPLGVIAAIIPWNTPLLMVGSKLGPALAAGNAVILKPSERACLGPLRFAELCQEAEIPAGVIQVISGDAQTGELLVSHPDIDKISFTGGLRTAQHIQRAAATHLKRVSFELGGKSPNIVFADADLERVPMLSAMGIFGLSGQACAAGSRLLVERSIHDAVVKQISGVASGLVVGDPLVPWNMLGPLIDTAHRERVQAAIAGAVAEGATVAWTGTVDPALASQGSFLAPHILTRVTPEMAIWREEVFGPVLSITPFDTEAEAIRLANSSRYGLAAGVWTQNLGRAHRMAARLQAGVVWVNTYGMLPNTVPFGGYKQSGWGREGGREAIAGVTQVKNVLIDVSE